MDEIGPDFLVERLIKRVTLQEKVEFIERLSTHENCRLLANNVQDVKKWVERGGFEFVVTDGQSGLISMRLLNRGSEPLPVDWLTKTHGGNPDALLRALESKGINSNRSVVFIDDRIGSGEKAQEYLLTLQGFGFKNFGFASIVGPREYCQRGVAKSDAIKQVLIKDEKLTSKLYFPDTGSVDSWKLMSGLERLTDFYNRSTLARECVDKSLSKIVSLMN